MQHLLQSLLPGIEPARPEAQSESGSSHSANKVFLSAFAASPMKKSFAVTSGWCVREREEEFYFNGTEAKVQTSERVLFTYSSFVLEPFLSLFPAWLRCFSV